MANSFRIALRQSYCTSKMANSFRISRKYKGHVDGITIRDATHEDYHTVIGIDPNIFEGLDYLPHMYHSYIDNPRRYCHVGIKDSQIVGFEMTFVVDDNQAIVNQSGRVIPSYRGQGIMSLLINHALSEVMKKHSIRRVLFTTTNKSAIEQNVKCNPEYKCVEMTLVNVMTPVNLQSLVASHTFREHCKKSNLGEVRWVSYPTFNKLITDSMNIQDYFPHGLIVVDREPLCVQSQGDRRIIEDEFKCNIFGTFDHDCALKVLSFGGFKPRNIGMQFAIDVYYNTTSNTKRIDESVVSHVLKHLQHEAENGHHTNVIIQVTYLASKENISSDLVPILESILEHTMASQVLNLKLNTQYVVEHKLVESVGQSKM